MSDQLNIFDEKPCRYLIIAEPDPVTALRVAEMKKHLHTLIPLSPENLHAKAHMTLCHHDSDYNSDTDIIQLTRQAVEGISAFEIEIDGLETWTSGHSGTLALKVVNPAAAQQLMAAVQKGLKKNEGKTPHITIARGISAKALDALPLTDVFYYRGTFLCGSVAILRKINQPGERYEVIERVDLDKVST